MESNGAPRRVHMSESTKVLIEQCVREAKNEISSPKMRRRSSSQDSRSQADISWVQFDMTIPSFKIEARGEVPIKGKGNMNTYWLSV